MVRGVCVVVLSLIACVPMGCVVGSENCSSIVQPVEFLPGVRVDRSLGVVEFDGTVPIDAYDPVTPVVFLELLVTGPDSREHESLIVTDVPPSSIHAGLLVCGLEPGSPASFEWAGDELVRTPASGGWVRVMVAVVDEAGEAGPFVPLGEWAVNQETGETLAERAFVFAGSRVVDRERTLLDGTRERVLYDADGTGTIVGLASFGSEVVSLAEAISPSAAVDAPVWVAKTGEGGVPPVGTAVIVRIEAD